MPRDKMNGGYPLPINPVVDSFVCLQVQIPNDPAYIAAVKGAITSLGQWFSWQRDNEEGGKIAAEIWRKTIFETLEIGGMCMDCCDDIVSINNQIKTIINNQSVNNISNTLNMVNDYSTIVSNYTTNAGNITILYPQVAAISPTTDKVMCLATKALVKMICDYRRERNKDAQVVNTVISVGFAIGAAAVTVFSGGTFLALGLGLASTGAALGATLYQVADAILDNTAAQKAVACAIYQNIIGVPVTKAVFETMADGLGFSPISSEGQIAELVRQFLTSDGAHATFMTMAEQQYAYAALGLLECDCEQVEAITIEWLYEQGTPANTTFVRTLPNQIRVEMASGGNIRHGLVTSYPTNFASMAAVEATNGSGFGLNVEIQLPLQQTGLPQTLTGKQYCTFTTPFGQGVAVITSAVGTSLTIVGSAV